MKPLLIALLGCSFNVAAGDFYIGVGLSDNSGNKWEDHGEVGGIFELGYFHQFDRYIIDAGWAHHSHPGTTALGESTLDQWKITARVLF